MARRNPWKGDDDATDRAATDGRTDAATATAATADAATAARDGTTYDPEADCRVRFTQEESERCLIVAEWHAGLRKAHGLPPEPDALRALLAVGCEAHLAWCRAYTLLEADREAALDDDDADVIALPGPTVQ